MMVAEFWTVLRIYCNVPSCTSELQSLSFRPVYLRANRWHKWPARTTASESLTVLRIYCHVPSWANQFQSPPVRSVSLCAPSAGTSDRHLRRQQSFGRFCASHVTCHRGPVSSSHFLYTLSLCAPPSVVPGRQYRPLTRTGISHFTREVITACQPLSKLWIQLQK
jgi:hypothetical protein